MSAHQNQSQAYGATALEVQLADIGVLLHAADFEAQAVSRIPILADELARCLPRLASASSITVSAKPEIYRVAIAAHFYTKADEV